MDSLSDDDLAAVLTAMRAVRTRGKKAARRVRGEIFEVRAFGPGGGYRIFFAEAGRRNQILLSLHAIRKQTQKTPSYEIELAERRLRDWQRRGTSNT